MSVRSVRAFGAVVGLAILTGCTSNDQAPPTTSAVPTYGAPLDEEPTLPELEIGPALWGGSDQQITSLSRVDFRGNSAILQGQGDLGAMLLSVVDATTGTPRWTLQTGDSIPGGNGAFLQSPPAFVSGSGEDFVVVVPYLSNTCANPSPSCPAPSEATQERGIAALSGEDGTALWMTPLQPSVAAGPDEPKVSTTVSTRLVSADDGTVVGFNASLGDIQSVQVEKSTTFALDALTGKEKWTASGVQPRMVVGGVVLTEQPASNADAAVAFDAESGEQLWSVTDQDYIVLAVAGANSDTAIISTNSAEGPRTLLVGLLDGETVTTPPTSRCTAGEDAVACAITDADTNGAQILLYADGKATLSERTVASTGPVADQQIDATSEGYVIVGQDSYRGDRIAVDASANQLGGTLPGEALAMTKDYVVFRYAIPGSEKSTYSVHTIG